MNRIAMWARVVVSCRKRCVLIGVLAILSFHVVTGAVDVEPPAHRWSHGFGDVEGDLGYGIATDEDGKVFVTGTFGGTVDFGGGPLASAGASDGFLAKFDADGAHLWSRSFGDAENDGVWGVAVDPTGDVVVTGFFGGTVDFGAGPVVGAGGAMFSSPSTTPAGITCGAGPPVTRRCRWAERVWRMVQIPGRSL